MSSDDDLPGWAAPPPPGQWPPPPPPGGVPLAWGPPGGITPGWPPAPPPTKRKLTWLWITLGVLATLAALTVTAIVLFVRSVQGPVATMNDFLGAIQDGRYGAAYEQLCADERATTTRDEFPTAISVLERDLYQYNVYSFDPAGDLRRVHFTVTDRSGDQRTYRASLVREDGEWRVCDFFSESATYD